MEKEKDTNFRKVAQIEEEQRSFLQSYLIFGDHDEALTWVEIPPEKHQRWLEEDPVYREKFDEVKRQYSFLRACSHSNNIAEASKSVGIPTETHDRWMKQDGAYRNSFERAIPIDVDKILEELGVMSEPAEDLIKLLGALAASRPEFLDAIKYYTPEEQDELREMRSEDDAREWLIRKIDRDGSIAWVNSNVGGFGCCNTAYKLRDRYYLCCDQYDWYGPYKDLDTLLDEHEMELLGVNDTTDGIGSCMMSTEEIAARVNETEWVRELEDERILDINGEEWISGGGRLRRKED